MEVFHRSVLTRAGGRLRVGMVGGSADDGLITGSWEIVAAFRFTGELAGLIAERKKSSARLRSRMLTLTSRWCNGGARADVHEPLIEFLLQ